MDTDPDSKKRRCFIDPCQSEILQGISTEHRLQQITYCNSSGSFATLAAIGRALSSLSIFAVDCRPKWATPRFTSELRRGPSLRGAVLLGPPETAERTLLLTKA